MIRKFFLIMLFVASFGAEASARSEWEGVWEYGRYSPSYGGDLKITDCRLNVCNFSIQTFHGAHTCEVSGKLKTNGTKALYYKYSQSEGDEYEQKIVMKLNAEKQTVSVDWQSGRFCGEGGDLAGVYENKRAPLRYATSYDCRAEKLSEAEKTICSSDKLAKAEREFAIYYPQKVTYAWKKERNACGADEECLWRFYTQALLEESKNNHNGEFSLYQYFQDRRPEWYFPTDYVLLQDYLMHNMTKDDYAAWDITLYDKSNTDRCENCSFMTYGVTGLFSVYESAFYIDEKDIWLAFVSANLPEAEKKNVIVYAPRGKLEREMPLQIKNWVLKMLQHHPEGMVLKYFERPKIEVINRNWYHKAIGSTWVDAPEPYASTIVNEE